MKKLGYITFFIFIFFNNSYAFENKIDSWKSAVVSIENQIIKSAYNNTGEFYSSGFIIDKEQGIIATNKHVVSSDSINNTTVTFHNGHEVEAKLLYTDPLADFSFLQVASTSIPKNSHALPLATTFPKINESVTIIGNNGKESLSIQTGIITNLFETVGRFPFQTIRISLNTRGGSSGSPIIDKNGKVVAINYGTNNTSAFALTSTYLNDAYQTIKKSIKPTRQETGIIFNYYSLDKAVKYLNFPAKEAEDYLKIFPYSYNKVLIANQVLSGTPAEKVIQPSDIIWKVNDKMIGPNLYDLQKAINESDKLIKFCVYRRGQLTEFEISTYKSDNNKINKMLLLDNAIFFEVDDYINLITGAPIGAVYVVKIEQTSSLYNINTMFINNILSFNLQISQINDKPIYSLNDIVELIPQLKAKSDCIIYYRNFSGQTGYDNIIHFNRAIQFQTLRISPYNEPLFYQLDESNTWTVKKL